MAPWKPTLPPKRAFWISRHLSDVAVLNREDPGAWGLRDQVRGRLVTFGLGQPPSGLPGTFVQDGSWSFYDGRQDERSCMPVDLIRLRGEHNLLNVLAACAIAAALPAGRLKHPGRRARVCRGSPSPGIRAQLAGRDWYNDSIATAPERTIAAIQAFDEPLVLLLGGRDKNLPWEKLADLVHQRVDHVVVFGEASGKILQAIGQPRAGRAGCRQSADQPGLQPPSRPPRKWSSRAMSCCSLQAAPVLTNLKILKREGSGFENG